MRVEGDPKEPVAGSFSRGTGECPSVGAILTSTGCHAPRLPHGRPPDLFLYPPHPVFCKVYTIFAHSVFRTKDQWANKTPKTTVLLATLEMKGLKIEAMG